MKHRATLAAALFAAGTIGTAATAQTAGGYYQAVPAVQPAKAKFVTRTTIWRLEGGTLVAGRAPERDMIVCQIVAKQTGGLTSFSAGGKAYDAATLDQCNGSRKPAGPLVAAAGGQNPGQ